VQTEFPHPSRADAPGARLLASFGGRRGLGHVTRQVAILRAFRRLDPRAEIALHLKVPDVHAHVPGEFTTVISDASTGSSLAESLRRLRPDLLLFDTLLPKEDVPRTLGERSRRPAVVLTLRQVRPERLETILESPWMDWVRLVLVPHAKGDFPLRLPTRNGLEVCFVGPILAERPRADLGQLRRRYDLAAGDRLIVASLGGGGVPDFARRFASCVLAAFRALAARHAHLRLVLVTGPKNDGVLDLDGLEAPAGVHVVPFDPELPELYRLASIVVAHGGYNTTHEILHAGTPILFLPCPAKYDDGEGRARALVERGAAYVGEAGDARAVERALGRFLGDPLEEERMRRAVARLAPSPGNDRAARALFDLVGRRAEELGCAERTLGGATSEPARRAQAGGDAEGGAGPRFRLPVLSWHLVDPAISDRWSVTPEAFVEQIEWLAGHARVIGLPEALACFDSESPAPPDAVVLTFDDGYESFLAHARPALDAHRMSATLFLITRFMGELNEWNSRAAYLARHMSWEQARELVRAGYEPGVHGRTHQALVKFDRERIKRELHGAANDIRAELGHEPRFAAYPFGSHDKIVVKVARKRFRLAFASGGKGVRDWREDPHRIHRIVVGPHLSLGEIAKAVHEYARG
jgi:peptidoglycan/xylan/chitin deacetylase (PgdA/CDA1 family)